MRPLLIIAGSIGSVLSVSLYGQCGGIGYTGQTTCDSPGVCTVLNTYYSQCLPSTGSVSSWSPAMPSTAPSTWAESTVSPTTSSFATSSATPYPSSATTFATLTAKSTTRTTGLFTTSTTSCTTLPGPPPAPTNSCGSVGNPYQAGYTPYINPMYASQVASAAGSQSTQSIKDKMIEVSQIPNFIWLDTTSDVFVLAKALQSARSQQQSDGLKRIVQIVIYDFPDKDCTSAVANPELTIVTGGTATYQTFLDTVSALISSFSDVRVVIVFEPKSIVATVDWLNVPKCANAYSYWRQLTQYALSSFQQCNVWLYLDGGSATDLGWPHNMNPTASWVGQLYNAVVPNRVRGLAIGVQYFDLYQTPTPDPIFGSTSYPSYDEIHYVNSIAPMLRYNGFPPYFLVDQSRAGRQNIRNSLNDWCNIKGAGFGLRPGTPTNSCFVDQIAWIYNGGLSDGTSDPSSPYYDSDCADADSKVPSPAAGSWFEAYFEALITYSNPPL